MTGQRAQHADAAARLSLATALHRHESGGAWDGCPPCLARADVALAWQDAQSPAPQTAVLTRYAALVRLFADDLEDVRVNYGGRIGTTMVGRARALANQIEQLVSPRQVKRDQR